MPTKKKSPFSDSVAFYGQLIATLPRVERKGDANPYTSVNGNMFTLLHEGQAGDPPAGRRAGEVPEEISKTSLYEAYGAVMQECVAVPDSLLAKTAELKKNLETSYVYAKTLKPKATKKKP